MEGDHCDVLIVGAGPAGSAVAMGLARLGHHVVVVDTPRRFDACEGLTARVVGWLRDAGFSCALAEVAAPSPRSVIWDGKSTDRNIEHLVWRSDFDRALRADLVANGIEIRHARLRRVLADSTPGPYAQLSDGQTMRSRMIVDARGRAGNKSSNPTRGPATLSISRSWTGPRAEAGSSLLAFEDGWAWLARHADGRRFTQLSIAADAPDLPNRSSLAAWLEQQIADLPIASSWFEGGSPLGEPYARASTALLNLPLWREEGVLRVGDAAMAVDPLSGNGTFQALSSASVAPAVVNTILRDPASAGLARDFYQDRLRHTFGRFARIGRDFYRSETRWRSNSFWRERSDWPDGEPAHRKEVTSIPITALRSVVDQGYIRQRECVVTDDQPLGVWHVAGVEVAPLLREVRQASEADRATMLEKQIEHAAAGSITTMRALRAWFATVGTVAPDAVESTYDN